MQLFIVRLISPKLTLVPGGINAVVVGIMIAATLYLLKDFSLLEFRLSSFLNAIVIAVTFTLLQFTKLPPPFIVIGCLLLGYFF